MNFRTISELARGVIYDVQIEKRACQPPAYGRRADDRTRADVTRAVGRPERICRGTRHHRRRGRPGHGCPAARRLAGRRQRGGSGRGWIGGTQVGTQGGYPLLYHYIRIIRYRIKEKNTRARARARGTDRDKTSSNFIQFCV